MSPAGKNASGSRRSGRSSPHVWCLRYATCPHPQTTPSNNPLMNGGQLIQVARRIPSTFRQQHGTCEHRIRPIQWHDHPDCPAARRSFPAGSAAARERMAVCSSATSMRWVTGLSRVRRQPRRSSFASPGVIASSAQFLSANATALARSARCHATHDKAYSRPSADRLRRTRQIGCRDSSIDHIVTVSSPTMHPITSRIRPDMARTASSSSANP